MFGETQMTSSALDSHSEEGAGALTWGTALSLTREMLDAARAGEWNRVLRLEPERRRLIERFLSAGVSPEEAELVRDGIIDILNCDQELMRLSWGRERRLPDNVIPFKPRGTEKGLSAGI